MHTHTKPKRTLEELAQEALRVQDACNLSGVVHGFSRAMHDLFDTLHAQGAGTDEINRHPIAQAWASKVHDLSRADRCDWTALEQLARGAL